MVTELVPVVEPVIEAEREADVDCELDAVVEPELDAEVDAVLLAVPEAEVVRLELADDVTVVDGDVTSQLRNLPASLNSIAAPMPCAAVWSQISCSTLDQDPKLTPL